MGVAKKGLMNGWFGLNCCQWPNVNKNHDVFGLKKYDYLV